MPTALDTRSEVNPAGYRDVSPLAALHHLGEVRLVDVREPDEFTGPLGHVPGAELVPLATVQEAAATWDRAQPLLMICRSGGRSGRAAGLLTAMGFRDVYNLMGGMLAWDANKLPVTRDDAAIAAVTGKLQAAFIAAAGGDVAAGTRAFEEAVGTAPCTPDSLRRAARALRPSESADADAVAGWTAQIESDLQRVG